MPTSPPLPAPPKVSGDAEFDRWMFLFYKRARLEYGTWTPVLTFATPGNLSIAYSEQSGQWTKLDRLMIVNFDIVTSSFTWTTSSGGARITGLPSAYPPSANEFWFGQMYWQGITKANYTHAMTQSNSAGYLALAISGSGQAAAAVNAADMPSGGSVLLRGTAFYRTD